MPSPRTHRSAVEPPDRFEVDAFLGWPALDPDLRHTPVLVQTGRLWLPERFAARVKANTEGSWTAWLNYLVAAGEVRMPVVSASPLDASEAIENLRRAWPMASWTKYAIKLVAQKVVHAELYQEILDERPPGVDPDEYELGAWAAKGRRLVAAVQAADDVPLARRRNRITPQHLDEVAEVYRRAEMAGEPPTKAVQEAFHVGYSTAARWVGLARNSASGTDMPAITRGLRKRKG